MDKELIANVDAFLDSQTERGECNPDTWRQWLRSALSALYEEDEGFSGKRPLGNSGWGRNLRDELDAAGVEFDDVLNRLFFSTDEIIECVKKKAAEKTRPDRAEAKGTEFDPQGWSGGNFDDAYSMGTEDGAVEFARELLGFLGAQPAGKQD